MASQMRQFLSQWSNYRVVAEDFVDLGDSPAGEVILVTERQYGTGKSSGLSVDQTFHAI